MTTWNCLALFQEIRNSVQLVYLHWPWFTLIKLSISKSTFRGREEIHQPLPITLLWSKKDKGLRNFIFLYLFLLLINLTHIMTDTQKLYACVYTLLYVNINIHQSLHEIFTWSTSSKGKTFSKAYCLNVIHRKYKDISNTQSYKDSIFLKIIATNFWIRVLFNIKRHTTFLLWNSYFS